MAAIDMTGRTFGRWTALERAKDQQGKGRTFVMWACRCACTGTRDVDLTEQVFIIDLSQPTSDGVFADGGNPATREAFFGKAVGAAL